jgi:hypothetical protein
MANEVEISGRSTRAGMSAQKAAFGALSKRRSASYAARRNENRASEIVGLAM